MDKRERLRQMLITWQTLRGQGRDAEPEELCRDCPELLEELRQQIETIRRWIAEGAEFGDWTEGEAE